MLTFYLVKAGLSSVIFKKAGARGPGKKTIHIPSVAASAWASQSWSTTTQAAS